METVSWGREDDGEDVGWRTQVNIRKEQVQLMARWGWGSERQGKGWDRTEVLEEDTMSLEKIWKRITDRTWPRRNQEPAAQIHQFCRLNLRGLRDRQWAILSALLTSLIELWRTQRDLIKRSWSTARHPELKSCPTSPNSPGRLVSRFIREQQAAAARGMAGCGRLMAWGEKLPALPQSKHNSGSRTLGLKPQPCCPLP